MILTVTMQRKEKKPLVSTVLLIQELSNHHSHNPGEETKLCALIYQKTETQGDHSDTKVMPGICIPAICITLEVKNKGNAEL